MSVKDAIDPPDEYREAVAAVLQKHGAMSREGAVLTGWVVVAEWMTPDGERWLSGGYDSASAQWKAEGMVRHFIGNGLFRGDEDQP